MLGFIFGFNARLGRLSFFLAGVALAILMTVICFAIAWHGFQRNPRSEDLALQTVAMPMLFAGLFFLFATFQLQSMRIRDIGWDPVIVLSVWLFLIAADKILAMKVPGLAVGPDFGTGLGALVNLVFIVVLTFWPSGEPNYSPPDLGGFSRPPAPPAGRSSPPSAVRASIASGASPAGFGRRGL